MLWEIGAPAAVLLTLLVLDASYSAGAHEAAEERQAAAASDTPDPASGNGTPFGGRALEGEAGQVKALTPAQRRQAREERQERIRRMSADLGLAGRAEELPPSLERHVLESRRGFDGAASPDGRSLSGRRTLPPALIAVHRRKLVFSGDSTGS